MEAVNTNFKVISLTRLGIEPLRKINVESTDPEMQARWGHIINPPLLKSLSTRADDARTVSTR